jgi:sulfur-oxidizing protein SoxY
MQGTVVLALIAAVTVLAGSAEVAAAETTSPAPEDRRATEDALWTGGLRTMYFQERPITESDDVVSLEAPDRADNAAIVPIAIRSRLTPDESRVIRTIWLVVDKNPGPLVGTFHFTPRNGRADLDLRIRINEYTPVRAIAETDDGRLYMSRRFVKASGGCSAPASGDLEAAMARMGQMKIRTFDDATPGQPTRVHLLISHPNLNGLQMDQLTGLYTPARFVKEVHVSFDGDEIFSAETSFAISENPSFEFYFVPSGNGEITAEAIDTNEQHFLSRQHLELASASPRS